MTIAFEREASRTGAVIESGIEIVRGSWDGSDCLDGAWQ